MRQDADDPVELFELVTALTYRPGWEFAIWDKDRGQGSRGLTFTVTTLGYNSYQVDRGQTYRVDHYFIVPAAAYNRQSWQHWLLKCLLEVEQHEACEFFAIAGDRPFSPNHGPGWDPYLITVLTTDVDRRTSFRGDLND